MPLLEAPAAVPAIQRNDLAHLQLEIARRADQLARLVISDPVTDIDLWSQAEQEVFARLRRAGANVTDL
ncbi:hypothetical protein [Opitutus sp. GAS368]|jgi:hypothetical protein|uniref:hypothetical protein n=1 Tax=Opitutus sp. GAS368 TaxID=1882749 RepID=UPI00087BBA35|nr:hypothetical protein [Opitutus sp. GAS368]SDS32816.1 hypothetical protein SAMN05444173_2564 [Opitutus sp. GAS368]